MDKEAIINKIISEAKKEAESIIEQAKNEIEIISKQDRKIQNEYKEKKLGEAKKEATTSQSATIEDSEK